ncbi:homoserine O-succinyltransferase [uncultured Anaerofustis sp.]|uniref:homoserine O-acetyltransferase MetA n=1 Tax=uncultured Anaerofustis sp. TaxID=904996 RepID=UPI0025F6F1C8|nr:homoserine O-succinyltransferase [uncultured Anaerofustis sp.]
MAVIIPKDLPASKQLDRENIFVMHEERAKSQDIRPLELAIVNLMPTKIVTETQLLRLISNTALQVKVDLINMKSHTSKNTSHNHLKAFYKNFDDIKHKKYDGMIITGAPVEKLEFDDVNYWEELQEIFDFADKNVFSTMFICWGAQAALNHYYGIDKKDLPEKMFGVFEHKIVRRRPIVRGFDDVFYAPHSRHTQCRIKDIKKIDDLEIVASSREAGAYLLVSKDQRKIFVFGHSEYDPNTLKKEYERDKAKGLNPKVPKNYFPNDDDTKKPIVRWKAHGHLLFSNWLNYHVYQTTPFDLEKLNQIDKEFGVDE